MRKWGTLTAAVAAVLLALAGTASAQESLRDAPAGGGEICDGAEGFEGQAGPFEPARAGFVDNGCGGAGGGGGGGEAPDDGGGEAPEDGGEESNPFCDGLSQFPEQMAPLTGPMGEGANCPAGGGEEPDTVASPPSGGGGDFHQSGAIVMGETETAPDAGAAGTGALPTTGAELLATASLGLVSLGAAARRFLR